MTRKSIKAGVIGWPVNHSLSPALHTYWLKQYGIAGNYDHYPVAPDELETFINALAANGFAGINSTLPHKEHVAQLMTRIDDTARAVGAVNMVVVEEDGTLTGHSTDGFGFVANLRAEAPQLTLKGARTLVLGAGGAAMSILHALEAAGAKLTLTNRTAERAMQLAKHFETCATLPWADRGDALARTDLLINTTSLGMEGQPPLEIDLAAMPPTSVVADCVYAPLETQLLAAARARGLTAVDGLGMLIHQARPAFKAWFGIDPEVTPALRAHLLSAQKELST